MLLYYKKRVIILKKGIVGIYVHNLKDRNGDQSSKGNNPFFNIYNDEGKRLSSFVTEKRHILNMQIRS